MLKNNRKMLVLGSNGQLGTDFCEEAVNAGYRVLGFDYPMIDITNQESVRSFIATTEASIVVNCAAFTAVDNCETEQKQAYEVNADAPGFLAEACQDAGKRLVHISTDYVFSGDKNEPYIESDATEPRTVYGKSKRAGEEKIAAACDNYQIFRIAWLYGLHGNNFVFTVRNLAKKMAGETGVIKIVNDQFGTPTSTIEVCRQIIRAQDIEDTGIFHATCDGSCTWFDFAKTIVEAEGIPVDVQPCSTEEFPRPAARPKNSRLENSRLKAAGIDSMLPWEEAFTNFLKSETN